MSFSILFLLLLATVANPVNAACDGEHLYDLVFDFNWSIDTDVGFPIDDPVEEPGFSKIVCASHSSNYSMWRPGEVLSPAMADFVSTEDQTRNLRIEIESAVANRTAKDYNITVEGAKSRGELTVSLSLNSSHSLISCASRINPSPAWFIGISAFDMCNGSSFRVAKDLVIIGWWGGLDEAEDYVETREIEDANKPFKVRRRIDFAPFGYGTLFISQRDPTATAPGDPQNQEAARTNVPQIVPAAEPICVDAKALQHLPSSALVFRTHRYAHVLCDQFSSCATPGHIVIYEGQPMMMNTYCQFEAGCEPRVMLVNSPKYSRALRVDTATRNLKFTTFAARFATQAEERFLSLAVRMGL